MKNHGHSNLCNYAKYLKTSFQKITWIFLLYCLLSASLRLRLSVMETGLED